jgi:hypothetical protein
MIEIRCKEHIGHLQHGQSEKSAVAEHIMNTGQKILFEKTHRLNRTTTYVDHMMKETTEITLHPNNFNQEDSFTLSQTWQPIANMFKHRIASVHVGVTLPGCSSRLLSLSAELNVLSKSAYLSFLNFEKDGTRDFQVWVSQLLRFGRHDVSSSGNINIWYVNGLHCSTLHASLANQTTVYLVSQFIVTNDQILVIYHSSLPNSV